MSTMIKGLLVIYIITGTQSSLFILIMIILIVSGTVFQALFTLLLELVEKKNLNAYEIGIIIYPLINISIISFYSIEMNYACEIIFLCEYFINHESEKNTYLILFY